MRARKKLWALIAVVLIFCGVAFGFVGFVLAGFDFSKLNGDGKEVTNEHVIEEDFSKIEIDTATSDIRFETATDGKAKVVCVETEKRYHDVSVKNGTLMIKETSKKKWFEFIGFFNGIGSKREIVIYLPEMKTAAGSDRQLSKETKYELEGLKIETSTGDVKVNDIYVKSELNINTSTGELSLSNVVAGKLIIDTSTGDVTMDETEVFDNMKIETSTGRVKMTKSDANTVQIDTSTGDVTCEFLSRKNVKTDTSTGSVSVQESLESGGACTIDTSTGDIRVTYAN